MAEQLGAENSGAFRKSKARQAFRLAGTDELLRRGYSEADIHKILGGNVLRAFRQAEQVANRLRVTPPAGRWY
jgi:hypothetical protein